MSRPPNLPAALQAWALANYSAGPSWGGTPQRSAPGAAFLTPGLTIPAEVANYLWGNVFDAAQGAVNAVGQIPALNWGGAVATSTTPIAIGWSDVEQYWYGVVASSTAVVHSSDFGKTWTAGNVLSTALGANAADIAVDTAGNICVVSGLLVVEGPFVTYGTNIAWTSHAGAFGATGNAANIVYEPTNARWAVIGSAGANPPWVYTSTTRATWASSTLPGTWTSGSLQTPTLGAGNGILVATQVSNSTTSQFRVMRSADGGVTWTNDQAIVQNAGIVLGAAFPTTRPVWSPTDGLWYLAVSQVTPRKTQVFTSPDGITWTSAATLLVNDCRFLSLASIGSLIIAMNDDGRVFCSVNRGVNWLRCGAIGATPTAASLSQGQTFKAGGNGALVISGSNSLATQRFGLPVTAA